MEQKPTIQSIDSIKKCKQDSRTLSLQETDNEIGVEDNWCSTFLSRSGLLAQGEYNKKKLEDRNALVTFHYLKTSHVKGKDSKICSVFLLQSLLVLVCSVTP